MILSCVLDEPRPMARTLSEPMGDKFCWLCLHQWRGLGLWHPIAQSAKLASTKVDRLTLARTYYRGDLKVEVL